MNREIERKHNIRRLIIVLFSFCSVLFIYSLFFMDADFATVKKIVAVAWLVSLIVFINNLKRGLK
ncbi:hypothetical protein [Mycoplasma sp. P36-A1]|uniref:hypothetical protein n=1 Tax=Mycoplasma sp. P36-A1 TaxID=3252900 RepID=UPI003C2DE0B6